MRFRFEVGPLALAASYLRADATLRERSPEWRAWLTARQIARAAHAVLLGDYAGDA